MGALIVVFLLSFCLYGLYGINTVTEVKINSLHTYVFAQAQAFPSESPESADAAQPAGPAAKRA